MEGLINVTVMCEGYFWILYVQRVEQMKPALLHKIFPHSNPHLVGFICSFICLKANFKHLFHLNFRMKTLKLFFFFIWASVIQTQRHPERLSSQFLHRLLCTAGAFRGQETVAPLAGQPQPPHARGQSHVHPHVPHQDQLPQHQTDHSCVSRGVSAQSPPYLRERT